MRSEENMTGEDRTEEKRDREHQAEETPGGGYAKKEEPLSEDGGEPKGHTARKTGGQTKGKAQGKSGKGKSGGGQSRVLEFLADEEFYDEEWEEPDRDDGEEKGSGSALNVLTFGVLIVLAVLVCTLVWVLTHREKEKGESGLPESNTEVSSELPSGPSEPEGGPSDSMPAQGQQPAGADGEVSSDAGAGSAVSGGTEMAEDPVSGDASMTFVDVKEDVTAKDVTNLRSVPSTEDSDNILTQLMNGETLTRTGINESTGWSRLSWNGQTVYAVTQFLTADLSYKPPVSQSDPNRVTTMDGRVIIFMDCDDTVTPKEYVNLRTEPSTSQGETTVRAQLYNGEQAHRTGYSPDSGWSRVEYDGQVLYVVTSYVINP